jgi:hypothetical protein
LIIIEKKILKNGKKYENLVSKYYIFPSRLVTFVSTKLKQTGIVGLSLKCNGHVFGVDKASVALTILILFLPEQNKRPPLLTF